MPTHTDKSQESQNSAVAHAISQQRSSDGASMQFIDNRPEAIQMRKAQEVMRNHNHRTTLQFEDNRPEAIAQRKLRSTGKESLQGNEFTQFKTMSDDPVTQLISISGETYAPARRAGSPQARLQLWGMVEQVLGQRYLSTHGCKGKFMNWVKEPGDYPNLPTAAESFVDEAVAQGWAKPFKLNRPKWPDDISEQSERGEDIRHIVRNATIKKSLQNELDSQTDADMAHDMMNMLARDIGINDQVGKAPHLIMKAIYNKCYLNRGNLWSGPGAVNRAIGLMADPLMALGNAYREEPAIQITSQDVRQYFEEIWNTAKAKLAIVIKNGKRLNPQTQATFFQGFDHWSKTFSDYLLQAQAQLIQNADEGMVSAYQIGTQLFEVGANLGFDTPDIHPNIRELIQVEQFLANYTGSDPDGLSDHLKLFMQIGGGLN